MTTETVHDLIQACLEGVSTAPTDVDVESQRQGKGPQLVAQHPARLRCRLDGLTSGCLEHRCAGLPAATADMSEWDISQHSQKFTRRRITLPCQNRRPAKDGMGPPLFGDGYGSVCQ